MSPADDAREAEPTAGAPKEGPGFFREVADFVVTNYASADPRSLGLFRIMLGSLLFFDVLRRFPDLTDFYSNAGVVSNHFAMFRPMSSHLFSVYHAFSTPTEVTVLACVHLAVNFGLIIGWRTKLMHVLAALLITSLNSRSVMLENGGWVVLNLLTVWSLFLPLGRRFSVDALRRSWSEWRESTVESLNDRLAPKRDVRQVVSLAVTALIAQWVVIYAFNVVHKNGPAWRDGSAVYYFFQQDRMVTALGAWVRELLPMSAIQGMTFGTLIVESMIAFLLVVPAWTRHARMVAFMLAFALHGGIDAVVQLGPFSWAMIFVFFVFIPKSYWDWVEERLRKRSSPRTVVFDADDGFSITFCRFLKRIDLLGLVRFAGAPGAKRPTPGPELPEAVTQKLVRKTLVVVDDTGEKHWTGAEALVRLCDALVIPRSLARVFGLGWFDSLVSKAARRRKRLTRGFALSDLRSDAVEEAATQPSTLHGLGENIRHYSAQVAVVAVLLATGSQVLMENHAIPPALKLKDRPEWMSAVVIYPRLFQGWSMFAPGPPMEDGRIVVDGRTVDGRKLDPFTGKEPNWEVQPKNGFRMNQLWGDFHRRFGEHRFRAYLHGVRDYLLAHHERNGEPADKLMAFDMWYVSEIIPPPGQPKKPPTRRRLLNHGVVTDPTPFPSDRPEPKVPAAPKAPPK